MFTALLGSLQIVRLFHSQINSLRSFACLLGPHLPFGKFPSWSNSSHNDILVQFCHGDPVFILSLHSLFPDLQPEITSAIQKVVKCILEGGVTTNSRVYVTVYTETLSFCKVRYAQIPQSYVSRRYQLG